MSNILYDRLQKKKEKYPGYSTNRLNKSAAPTFKADEDLTPPKNILNTLSAAPTTAAAPTAPAIPKDTLSEYWGQPVVGKMPLDQFVRTAGMAASAIDPTGPSGRLGRDLAGMGAEAYGERMKREYESPNKLLQRRLALAQIKEAENKPPTEWKTYYEAGIKAGLDPVTIVSNYKKEGHVAAKPTYKYIEDNKGNVSIYADGVLQPGSSGKGRGKDITKEINTHVVDDKGMVTFFNKEGKVISKQPGGKTKAATDSAFERMYTRYRTKYITRKGKGMLKNPAGKMMEEWELKKHLAPLGAMYMTEQGPVFKNPTGIVDAQGVAVPPEVAAQITGIPKAMDPTQKKMLEKISKIEEGKAGGFWNKLLFPDKVTPEEPAEEPTTILPTKEVPAFTEMDLREMLEEKRKTDLTINVEEALKTYKAAGMY